MIPAGVFNQGIGIELYSLKFNGSYAESQNPSSPLGLINEIEVMYNTNGTSMVAPPPPDVILKPGYAVSFTHGESLSDASKYSSMAANNNRLYRGIVNTARSGQKFSPDILLDFPAGTLFKLHFWTGGLSGDDINIDNMQFFAHDVSTQGDLLNYFSPQITQVEYTDRPFNVDPYAANSGWYSSGELIFPNDTVNVFAAQTTFSLSLYFTWSILGIEIID